jgi:PAS domain S-box-containing protein
MIYGFGSATIMVVLIYGALWFSLFHPLDKFVARIRENQGEIRVKSGILDVPELETIGRHFNSIIKSREESEGRFQTMADTAPVLIWMSSGQNHFTYFNTGWINFTGRELQEELGQGWQENVHPRDLRRFLNALSNASRNLAPFIVEYRLRHADGDYRWILTRGVPRYMMYGSKKFCGYIGCGFDITERIGAERELVKSNRQIHNQAEALELQAKELAVRTDQVLESTRAKSEFLAKVSHEIRTPMNGIIGFSKLLLDQEMSDEQQDYVQTIHASAEILLDLINQILDLSKIESGNVELENVSFPLIKWIESIVDLIYPQLKSKELDLFTWVEADVPDRIFGDPGRLRLVLINILANAVKFTQKGSITIYMKRCPIQIEEDPTPPPDNECRIEIGIRDTGIGIPADKFDKVFETFSQADASTTRKYGGSGLGLAIAKPLAELMGGGIELESEIGKGSLFRVFVQSAVDDRVLEDTDQSPLDFLRGKSLLVLTGNEYDQRSFSQMADRFGMRSPRKDFSAIAEFDVSYLSQYDFVIIESSMVTEKGVAYWKSFSDSNQKAFSKLVLFHSQLKQADFPSGLEDLFKTVIRKPLKMEKLERLLVQMIEPMLGSTRLRKETSSKREGQAFRHRNLEVIYAEDNRINQKLTQLMLTKIGMKVDLVLNGQELIDAIQDKTYNVILMDMHMPVMDGLQATIAIRKGEAGSENLAIPIIAMTANAMQGDADRCLEAGMNDYTTKPVKLEELLQSLDKCLSEVTGPERA